LLATIAFVAHRYSRRWLWFTALSAFACLKYGAWTSSFLLKHWSGGGLIEPISAGLFITHIGLMAEGALLVPQIGRLSLGARLATIGWFALSIFVDYGLGFHPPLTPQVPVEFVFWLATGLT